MEESSTEKFKSYTIKNNRILGVNDLIPEYVFRGASQGDESTSNSVKDYQASGGWMIPVNLDVEFDVTDQVSIDKEIERRKIKNQEYINYLKQKGEYGKEIEESYTFNVIHNPLFDDMSSVQQFPLDSHRLIFIK